MLQFLLDSIDKLAAKADVPGFNWVKMIVIVLTLHDAFEGYVDYRQAKVLDDDTIPAGLEKFVDEKELTKTRIYGQAKLRFTTYSRVFKLIIKIAAYQYLLLATEWNIAESIVSSANTTRFSGEITKSVAFINVAHFIDSFIEVPFEYYYQFVLEEKFGFNKSTTSLFVADWLKKNVIAIFLNSALIAGLGKVVQVFGNQFFIYAGIFVVGFSLLFTVASPLIIDPLFNKYEPLEDGELKDAINALAKKLDFPLTRIYVQDSSKRTAHSNAYFMGLPWYKQIVLFDTLIESSSKEEIVAILGHELGHWKLNHIGKLMVINSSIIFLVFMLFALFIDNKSLYQSLGFSQSHWIVGMTVFTDILAPAQAPLKFMLTYNIRKHEYDADEFSANLGYGKPLQEGLITLSKENLGVLHADPLYAAYRHSHPILPTRLNALKQYTHAYETKTK